MLVLTSCTQGQQTETTSEGKDLYIQLYSVRDDIRADYEGTIQAVADMGYTGIEAAGYNDGQFYGMTPADFKQSIEDAGMEVLSSHTARPLAENPAETNWDDTWAWWDTAIQAHKDAGMKYIVAPWMPLHHFGRSSAIPHYYNQIESVVTKPDCALDTITIALNLPKLKAS